MLFSTFIITFIIRRALAKVISLHYFWIYKSPFCISVVPLVILWVWSSTMSELCSLSEIGPQQMDHLYYSDSCRLTTASPGWVSVRCWSPNLMKRIPGHLHLCSIYFILSFRFSRPSSQHTWFNSKQAGKKQTTNLILIVDSLHSTLCTPPC